jgi:hypothetical protein
MVRLSRHRSSTAFALPQSIIIDSLESARARIEERFSLAGRLLENAIDVVTRQIDALDRLAAAINDRAVGDAAADLADIGEKFKVLPAVQAGRNERLSRLADLGGALRGHIEDMRVNLKYLRVFVFNMKITAAGSVTDAGSFKTFTEEMIERIEHGFGELSLIDRELADLHAELQRALAAGQDLQTECSRMLPEVPDRLASDAGAIAAFHRQTAATAEQVSELARVIQRKVADTLSALQIGDITRQRIEHVQGGLRLLNACDFGAEERSPERLSQQCLAMLADQMDDIAVNFHREAARITGNLAGLAVDSAQAVQLQSASGAGGQSGLRGLEDGVAQAVSLASDLAEASRNADAIGRLTGQAVDGLAERVSVVRMVKADVQRMAINTSLRCSRLGEAGKPLNVIASELGAHAGRLDGDAEKTLVALDGLQGAATDLASVLASDGGETDHGLTDRLQGAAVQLRQAADVVDRDLGELAVRGADLAEALGQTEARLKLAEDLGDVLAAAAHALRERAGRLAPGEALAFSPAYTELMGRIHQQYTMARERIVHAPYVEAPTVVAIEPEPLVVNGLF